jgi:hypothetical protein
VSRRILFAAALLVLPALAVAQRGGGSKATTRTPVMDKDETPQGPSLRPRDVEDASPIKLLLDKRKDLKLNDTQMNALKAHETSLKNDNAPLLKAVDSLVHEMKPPLNSTAESREHIRDAGQALHETLQKIQTNYEAATKDVLTTFEPEQQTKANELLAKQKEETDKMMREKMGEGGGQRP